MNYCIIYSWEISGQYNLVITLANRWLYYCNVLTDIAYCIIFNYFNIFFILELSDRPTSVIKSVKMFLKKIYFKLKYKHTNMEKKQCIKIRCRQRQEIIFILQMTFNSIVTRKVSCAQLKLGQNTANLCIYSKVSFTVSLRYLPFIFLFSALRFHVNHLCLLIFFFLFK